MIFLINLGGQSHPSIWTLYTQYKFHWSALQIGLSLAAEGHAFGIGQGVSTRILVPRMGEMNSIVVGSFLIYAFITKSWMVYSAIILFVFTEMTAVLGPLLYIHLFESFTRENSPVIFPGAPYLAAAFFALICLLLSFKAKGKKVR